MGNKVLKARVIEGVDRWYEHSLEENEKYHLFVEENNDCVCVIAPCNQEGFNQLFNVGKMLWDNGFCSKFEIAAFDKRNLFWKHRPDQYNFERNSYKNRFGSVIEEEYQSFMSDDFQNDELELNYLRDYYNRFWSDKHAVYSVERFEKLVKDTQLYEDFNAVRDWINKMEDKVPLDVLSDMSFIPRECGFLHNGQWILNPFYDETLRFGVEPFSYYGKENVRGYVQRMKQTVLKKPLSKQIASAEQKKLLFDNKKDIALNEAEIKENSK